MLIIANKMDISSAEKNINKLKDSGLKVVPCCAEAELALRKGAEKKILRYFPGDRNFKVNGNLTDAQKKALERIEQDVLNKWGSTGVQQALNSSFIDLLNMILVYPVLNSDKLTDHQGRILPEAYLVPKGINARQFAYIIHTDLGENFIYAIEARSKNRVGEDYQLVNGDVISIISAKKRG
jgi:ribosome-binding ATPase YchF (GTP1/OBG family)